MRKLVIQGVGPFAELVQHYFARGGRYRVCGFVSDADAPAGETFCQLPVVHAGEMSMAFGAGEHDLFVAIGHEQGNRLREQAFTRARGAGYRLASHVCPSADVAGDFRAEANVLIMERAGIQPFVTVGPDTVIGAGARIGFRARIAGHCWIDCALFGESVEVGHHCTVGLGATVAPFVSIGAGSDIGPGVLLTGDTPAGAIVAAPGSEVSAVPSHRLRRL